MLVNQIRFVDDHANTTTKPKCPTISQSKLAWFAELRQLKKQLDELQQELLELHLRGAKQEEGDFALAVGSNPAGLFPSRNL